MIDLRQTSEYSKYIKCIGWSVASFQLSGTSCQIFIKKISLLGNIAKLQRASGQIDFKKLEQIIKKRNIKAIFIEPLEEQTSIPLRFKSAESAFLPTKTIQIDLNKSEDRLLSEMKQKTRYNIKLAKRNGVIIKKSQDIDTFVKLWQKTSLTRGTWLPAKKEIKGIFDAFEKKCFLLFAYASDVTYIDISNMTPVAGVLVACSPDTAFYLYAASTDEGKKLFAPTLLSWEAISEAKKRKLKIFDFDGIYDERYPKQNKAWVGFTKFKEGFGGTIIEFPKTLVCKKSFLTKLFF